MQANRSQTVSEPASAAGYKRRLMETNDQRRKRKLSDLCAEFGIDAIASDSGLSAEYLRQILNGTLLPKKGDGTRSPRKLGDEAARSIEEKRGLGIGWFDNDRDDIPMTPRELLMLGHFRNLPNDLQDFLVEQAANAVERQAAALMHMRDTLKIPDPIGDERVGQRIKPAPRIKPGK